MPLNASLRFVLNALTLVVCVGTAAPSVAGSSAPPVVYAHRSGPLTAAELDMARIAWRYFENNYQPETGLVNAVDGYPSTTLWDSASYIGGLVSAFELGIIDKQVFDERLAKLLRTFNSIEFFRGELPNKVYHTKTADKVNYANKPGEIGFSALDLGRLLIWLKIIKERYPEHANAVDNFVLRWDFSHVVDSCGTLYGATLDKDKKVQYVQEGRLGYEEYAAKGFQLWGFSTCKASSAEPMETLPVYCVNLPYDSRDPRKFSQHNYVVTESYALDGIEMGWDLASDRLSTDVVHTDKVMENFAQRVYFAQENRYREAGILTARSEHQLDQAPYFVYDTVYTDGFAWNTITDNGKVVPEFAAISLKAALGMWALWDSSYTNLLADAIWHQYVPEKGYYEGILENGKGPIRTFTANNNGIMLETLLFKQQGKLLKYAATERYYGKMPPSLWERKLQDGFNAENKARARPTPIATKPLPAGKSWFGSLFDKSSTPNICPVMSVCPECQEPETLTLPEWSSCR